MPLFVVVRTRVENGDTMEYRRNEVAVIMAEEW